MDIDIIDLTLPEFSKLTPMKLHMVTLAQVRKNQLLEEAEEKIRKMVFATLANRFSRSSTRAIREKEIMEKYKRDVEVVRENLLYDLVYKEVSDGNALGPYSYPDNPNYKLTESQRYLVVRQYYYDLTSDANARFEKFKADRFAQFYLGKFYQPLYDLFYSLTQ